VKNLTIAKAVKIYKSAKEAYESFKTPEFKAAEKEFSEVKDFIADYAKAQGAFSLKGINVEVTPVNGWDVEKLEAFALRHPALAECRKETLRTTIRLIN
jgi:hypothetical protein